MQLHVGYTIPDTFSCRHENYLVSVNIALDDAKDMLKALLHNTCQFV